MDTSPIPKKILYIITKANFGGAQRYVYELATHTAQSGHEVAVATGGTGELTSRLHEASITTFTVAGLERDLGVTKELRALYSLFTLLRTYHPDVVHLNSGKAGVLGAFVAFLMRVETIVFTAHGWSFLEDRPRWWKLLVWLGSYVTSLCADHVIVVSEHDKTQTCMPLVTKKISVIHTAITNFPTESRSEARASLFTPEVQVARARDIWLVTAAELNHNKNHVTAIDAVAEFNSTHSTKIFYTIIGDGELRGALEEQVALRGLREQVHFAGYVADARTYLPAFDIFLLPSKKEGLPYALLEAGNVGLPCIASEVGGIPEVIANHESGFLINPENHMSIVTALTTILENPDTRTAYADTLKQHITEHFNLETMLQDTTVLYDR
jgi:glycosyltransferase involved in cell wall biosynthesis